LRDAKVWRYKLYEQLNLNKSTAAAAERDEVHLESDGEELLQVIY